MAAKYRYPIMRSPKSDPQQYRVYRLENEAIGARQYMQMTRTAVLALVASVCRNYRVPKPTISWNKPLGKWAAEWMGPTTKGCWIFLNPKKGSAKDILTITHELAHHIHYCLSKGADEHQEPHGPEFMACHMSILDTCRIVPVIGMRAICTAWKVRFYDPGTTNSLAKLTRIVRRR